MIVLDLPFPPSVNHYFGSSGKRRYLLPAAIEFREHVGAAFLMIDPAERRKLPLRGSLQVEILLFPPDRRTRDIDNILKPTFDALQWSRIILNDKDIDKLVVERIQCDHPGGMRLTVSER